MSAASALIAIFDELHGDEHFEPGAAMDEPNENIDASELPLFVGLFARLP